MHEKWIKLIKTKKEPIKESWIERNKRSRIKIHKRPTERKKKTNKWKKKEQTNEPTVDVHWHTHLCLTRVQRPTNRLQCYSSTDESEIGTDTPRCPFGRLCWWLACGRGTPDRTSPVPQTGPWVACTWGPRPGCRAAGCGRLPSCTFPDAWGWTGKPD